MLQGKADVKLDALEYDFVWNSPPLIAPPHIMKYSTFNQCSNKLTTVA